MKLSTFTAKLTCIKHNALGALAVATFAAAAVTATAASAQAQRWSGSTQSTYSRNAAPVQTPAPRSSFANHGSYSPNTFSTYSNFDTQVRFRDNDRSHDEQNFDRRDERVRDNHRRFKGDRPF